MKRFCLLLVLFLSVCFPALAEEPSFGYPDADTPVQIRYPGTVMTVLAGEDGDVLVPTAELCWPAQAGAEHMMGVVRCDPKKSSGLRSTPGGDITASVGDCSIVYLLEKGDIFSYVYTMEGAGYLPTCELEFFPLPQQDPSGVETGLTAHKGKTKSTALISVRSTAPTGWTVAKLACGLPVQVIRHQGTWYEADVGGLRVLIDSISVVLDNQKKK